MVFSYELEVLWYFLKLNLLLYLLTKEKNCKSNFKNYYFF